MDTHNGKATTGKGAKAATTSPSRKERRAAKSSGAPAGSLAASIDAAKAEMDRVEALARTIDGAKASALASETVVATSAAESIAAGASAAPVVVTPPAESSTTTPPAAKASNAAPRETVTVTDDKGREHKYTGPVRKAADGAIVINGHDQYRAKYAARVAAMTTQAVIAEKLTNMVERLARLSDETAHWPDVKGADGVTLSTMLADASARAKACGVVLAALPAEWKAPAAPAACSPSRAPRAKIAAGSVARFKATRAADYSDDASADASLTVVEIKGSRAKVREGERPAFYVVADDLTIA